MVRGIFPAFQLLLFLNAAAGKVDIYILVYIYIPPPLHALRTPRLHVYMVTVLILLFELGLTTLVLLFEFELH
jgi:hypothetical protein